MSAFTVDPGHFSQLKDRVVVITGGSAGIGAAVVRQLHGAGAHVFFGDVDADGASLTLESVEGLKESEGSTTYVACNATVYEDVYNLFMRAYHKHGRVDHAIANAGIIERGDLFDRELTIENVGSKRPDTTVIDVNLLGLSSFARIAVVFMREGFKQGKVLDPSLTLLSSIAGFRSSPGMFFYQASKHGVIGLMRAMRQPIYERDHVRVNCVCPGFTRSPMTRNIFSAFEERGLPTQEAEDVAGIILGVLVANEMNGKSLYVERATGWEFEDGFWDHMDVWLGQEPARLLKLNAEFINSGALTGALKN